MNVLNPQLMMLKMGFLVQSINDLKVSKFVFRGVSCAVILSRDLGKLMESISGPRKV